MSHSCDSMWASATVILAAWLRREAAWVRGDIRNQHISDKRWLHCIITPVSAAAFQPFPSYLIRLEASIKKSKSTE